MSEKDERILKDIERQVRELLAGEKKILRLKVEIKGDPDPANTDRISIYSVSAIFL